MNTFYASEDFRDGEKIPTVRLEGDFTAIELLEVLRFQIDAEKQWEADSLK